MVCRCCRYFFYIESIIKAFMIHVLTAIRGLSDGYGWMWKIVYLCVILVYICPLVRVFFEFRCICICILYGFSFFPVILLLLLLLLFQAMCTTSIINKLQWFETVGGIAVGESWTRELSCRSQIWRRNHHTAKARLSSSYSPTPSNHLEERYNEYAVHFDSETLGTLLLRLGMGRTGHYSVFFACSRL